MATNLKSKNRTFKNSINAKIWSYLVLFSFLILIFLWVFQILFLSSYYEWRKTKDMKQLVNQIALSYRQNETMDGFLEKLETVSFENGICIELSNGSDHISYTSNFNDRECIKGTYSLPYKEDFINSNQFIKKYTLINPQFENKTLIYGLKLDDSLYAFISFLLFVKINSLSHISSASKLASNHSINSFC